MIILMRSRREEMVVGARAADMSTNIVSNEWSPATDQHSGLSIKIMLIIFLCLLSIVLVLAILHLYIRHIIRRRMTAISLLPVSGENPRTGLNPIVIAALPTFPYCRPGKDVEAPTECAVCLSVVVDGEVVRLLPNCMHVFHVACIEMWLHSHSTCPLCRADAVPKEAGEASASQSSPELLSGGASLGPALGGTSGPKEGGSSRSQLGSSFRRMLSCELPARRMQGNGVIELEKQQ